MPLHRILAPILLVFSLLLLAWNIATPGNEDHVVNVAEDLILVAAFAASMFLTPAAGGMVQVAAMFIASSLTAYAGDFQPAAFVGALALMLTFAYRQFRTIPDYLLSMIVGVQFAGVFFAAMVVGYSVELSIGHALLWTVAPMVTVWVIWQIMKAWAPMVVKNSSEVHELNKKLMSKGTTDAAENTRGN